MKIAQGGGVSWRFVCCIILPHVLIKGHYLHTYIQSVTVGDYFITRDRVTERSVSIGMEVEIYMHGHII